MDLANDGNLSIAYLAPRIRKRKLSPVELTRFVLDRIDRLQPRLNAFITVTPQIALRQATEAEDEIASGVYRGPLHGIPFCLKDLYYTRDVRTTAGSKILRRFKPRANAWVVDRLFEAGIVLVGKTNLHEFAFGATNNNPHFGPVRNPWLNDRISGGSSGGSAAAVVAGLAVASLGTDTGGSVRIPAAACGCVGFKPTFGRIPMDGIVPLATSLDHAGAICRSVTDAATVLGVITGVGSSEPSRRPTPYKAFTRDLNRGIKELRVGVPRQYFFDRLQPEVRRLTLAAIGELEGLGAVVREVRLKLMSETARLAAEITVAEALAYHWEWLHQRPEDYGPDLRSRMEASRDMTAVTYIRARQRCEEYRREFAHSMREVDLIAAPTLPVTAPPIDDGFVQTGGEPEDVRLALLRLTRPGNLTGFPAVSVPCGFTEDGLPVGLQLIGHPTQDALVLRAAYTYEQNTPWHRNFPE